MFKVIVIVWLVTLTIMVAQISTFAGKTADLVLKLADIVEGGK